MKRCQAFTCAEGGVTFPQADQSLLGIRAAIAGVWSMTKRLSCWSCRHSAGHIGGALRCVLHERWAIRTCRDFEYEPGTDEHERIAAE